MLTDAPTPAESAVVAAHRAYLERMAAAGIVLLFGRTPDDGRLDVPDRDLPRRLRGGRPADHGGRPGGRARVMRGGLPVSRRPEWARDSRARPDRGTGGSPA